MKPPRRKPDDSPAAPNFVGPARTLEEANPGVTIPEESTSDEPLPREPIPTYAADPSPAVEVPVDEPLPEEQLPDPEPLLEASPESPPRDDVHDDAHDDHAHDNAVDPPRESVTVAAESPAALEARVRRLEEALAMLQQGKPPTAVTSNSSVTVPLAVPTATQLSPNPPQAVPANPSNTTPGSNRPGVAVGTRGSGWLSWEMLIELRVFVRMFTDPRYQMSWYGRTVPLALLLIFIFSNYTIPLASVLVVGWLFEKLGVLIVLYLLVKSLSYEARRYRQKAPDLPPSLRL